MDNKTKTDVTFELIEGLETKKRWLKIVVIGCLILAPIGLCADVYSFVVLFHQKSGLLDQQIVSIVFVFITLILILSLGIDKYIKLEKWNRNLQQLELLEETIYKEVLSPSRQNKLVQVILPVCSTHETWSLTYQMIGGPHERVVVCSAESFLHNYFFVYLALFFYRLAKVVREYTDRCSPVFVAGFILV